MARVLSRREVLAATCGAGVVLADPATSWAQRRRYQLGYGLYGMKTIPHLEGLGHIARIGYKHTEITLRPGWDTEPKLLDKTKRAAIRKRIDDLGLTLDDVMEGIQPASPNATLESNLERLKMAAECAHECSPGKTALIQCPIGGRPGTFMERREAMAEELSIWASRLDELDVTFCIKPHSKQAMGRPEELIWMLQKVNHPRMKGVYDYGHFMAFGYDMVTTVKQLAPYAAFTHLKDTIGQAPNHHFVLPGEGGVDYPLMLRAMAEQGYSGPVVVEVSTDVFSKPGYHPIATAEKVWKTMSPVFAAQ